MTDKVQKESASSTDLTLPEPGEASQGDVRESSDTVDKLPPRPEAPRGFSVVQYSMTVPKPSYHRHLEANENALDDVDQSEWSDSGVHPGSEMDDGTSEGQVDPALRERKRKIRLWGYLLLVILIYGVLRTLRFMH